MNEGVGGMKRMAKYDWGMDSSCKQMGAVKNWGVTLVSDQAPIVICSDHSIKGSSTGMLKMYWQQHRLETYFLYNIH